MSHPWIPGPKDVRLTCGCFVGADYGAPGPTGWAIYCPVHAAAPEMASLLRDVLDEYNDGYDASCEPGEGWRGSGRIGTATGEAVRALLDTLAPDDEAVLP